MQWSVPLPKHYYHSLLKEFYRFTIPESARVLHIDCKNYTDYESLEKHIVPGTFDYIVLSSIIMEIDDVQALFENIKKYTHAGTRLIIDWHRPTQLKNWLTVCDVNNFLQLAGFEMVTQGRHIMMPLYIPGVSWFCNKILSLVPIVSYLCLNRWIIARPKPLQLINDNKSVSVVIPCRNEKGTVEAAVLRIPNMGPMTEIIFVEGHSQDGTREEIDRVIKDYPHKNIKVFVQTGKGKGDAVRLGFSHAQGDILMILDADLTMQPEDLPKFYKACASGTGEFINGSRLVYGLEAGSMRFLNIFVNHAFGILLSWILGQKIKDTLCGTKVITRSDYELIAQHRNFFGDFDPFGDFDLLFGAAKLNRKIIDMPVRYKSRVYGASQIGGYFFNGLLLLHMSWIGFKKFKMKW